MTNDSQYHQPQRIIDAPAPKIYRAAPARVYQFNSHNRFPRPAY